MQNELLYASPQIKTKEARFNAFMMAFAVYIPTFAVFNGGGFLVIYILGYLKVLQTAPWQLVAIAGLSLLLAIVIAPANLLLRQGRDDLTAVIMPASIGLFLIGLNLFWFGYLYFLYAAAWISPALQLWQAAKTRQKIVSVIIGALTMAGLYFSELARPFERMPNNTDTALFAFWFLIFAIGALITLALLLRVVVFRSLSTRLLASFMVIVFLPLILTTLVSGLSTQTQNEQRVQEQLNTISQLKQTQIEQITSALDTALQGAQGNASFGEVRKALRANRSTQNFAVASRNATAFLQEIINQYPQYQEIFILDPSGQVLVSSSDEAVGRDYSQNPFFQLGITQEQRMSVVLNSFTDLSSYGPASLIATAQITDESNADAIIGLVAMRTSFAPIETIINVDPGLGESDESFLVDENYTRLTPAIAPEAGINTTAATAAITGKNVGTVTYVNKQNIPVIGAYRFIPSLNAAIITEFSVAEAQRATTLIIAANILLSLLTAGIAAMAVMLTARTISNPIVSLAETARHVSQGQLSERVNVEREDEIGTLAIAFNAMADELQKLVSALEARVAERTTDLERQARRLRAAAEVARDAASARDLDDLLNRSAKLILDRFGFYHTGIFLLDNSRQYAVLRASPTEAGQLMLARRHQLRVGEVGIVGFVAATGESRVVLDTGADSAYFHNPLLPNTRSELALPLKVENRVIGVLDVQSEQLEAFMPEDTATLQVMADQLSIAIERTRLLQESQQNLAEIERVSQSFTVDTWRTFTESQKLTTGYRFEGIKLEPITDVPAEARQVLKRGDTLAVDGTGDHSATLSVPVKLRGQTIGVINVRLQTQKVPADTASMLEEAAVRLGFALENSRLIAESQQRAGRERAIANASAKIGASRETEQIMRVAIEELHRLLGDPEVAIQFKTELDK
jgi:GAF domain-containing protein/HAMP domain-containing protein